MRQAGEPSVEEILESIKKVIARDNRTASAEERQARAQSGVAETYALRAEPDDDVLELREAAELDEPSAHIDQAAPVDDDRDDAAETPLLGEDTRASMRDSLAALAMLSEPGRAPQIVRSGETSLEALTRDLLRPALAQWLDQNLPPLVERLVAAEIARIVGKKG